MKKSLFASILALAFAAPAFAQTENALDFGKNTEISFSLGHANVVSPVSLKFDTPTTPAYSDNNSTAYQLAVSTSLTKDVRVELFGGYLSDFGTDNAVKKQSYLKWHSFMAGVGLSAPLFVKDAHSVNFKSGLAVVYSRSLSNGLANETEPALVFGAEYKYKLNKNYSLGAQVQYITDLAAPGSSAPVYSLTVSYAL